MAGRRRSGQGLAAGLNVLSGGIQLEAKNRLEEQQERRKFAQRLVELGITQGVKTGQLSPQFSPQGQFGGFQRTDPLGGMIQGGTMNAPGQPFIDRGNGARLMGSQASPYAQPSQDQELPEGTTVTQTIKTPQGTITIKRGGAKPTAQKFLTEGQTGQMLSGAEPGYPLPSQRSVVDRQGVEQTVNNIPVSVGGRNTMNAAIQSGLTESPAAQYRGMILPPSAVPQGPFVQGPGGTFLGGQFENPPTNTVPRQQVVNLVRSGPASFAAPTPSVPMAPPPRPGLGFGAPPIAAQPQSDPIAQRIQQLLSSGVSPARIANDLRAKGIDPSQYGL